MCRICGCETSSTGATVTDEEHSGADAGVAAGALSAGVTDHDHGHGQDHDHSHDHSHDHEHGDEHGHDPDKASATELDGSALADRASAMARLDRAILAADAAQADANRRRFAATGTLVINLMSSPGAGKTTLLEHTVERLGAQYAIAVIEGDLATENDARRLRARGIQAEQIMTGSACHLDARMIAGMLDRFDLEAIDVLFIENVGNLICPACFDLGQHHNVTLLSVPEGEDKPEKYPVMFRAADLVLLTKTDYVAVAPAFDESRVLDSLRSVGSGAPLIPLCAITGSGMTAWADWLRGAFTQRRRMHSGTAAGT